MGTDQERFLAETGIEYERYEHPAVYTCEEAEEHCSHVPGKACKNLLLKDSKNRCYILIILPAEKTADIKGLTGIIGAKKTRFARAGELEEVLGVEPGAVSPMGLINDEENSVKVFIDRELWEASEGVNFHPNINSASLHLSQDMFRKMMDALGNSYETINA